MVVFLPTSWRRVGLWFLEPGGRPGPGREGFGALAGRVVFSRRFRNPRRMRAGVSRCGLVAGFLPWSTQIAGEVACQSKLGVGDHDDQDPAFALVRCADAWSDPAQGLLEEPEGVFQVEAAMGSGPS
jgi:hypothetical protein